LHCLRQSSPWQGRGVTLQKIEVFRIERPKHVFAAWGLQQQRETLMPVTHVVNNRSRLHSKQYAQVRHANRLSPMKPRDSRSLESIINRPGCLRRGHAISTGSLKAQRQSCVSKKRCGVGVAERKLVRGRFARIPFIGITDAMKCVHALSANALSTDWGKCTGTKNSSGHRYSSPDSSITRICCSLLAFSSGIV
jgi:hypothetical protein